MTLPYSTQAYTSVACTCHSYFIMADNSSMRSTQIFSSYIEAPSKGPYNSQKLIYERAFTRRSYYLSIRKKALFL